MKALLVSAAAIGLLSAAPAFANAGPTATGNGTADATIVAPITVTTDANTGNGALHFGKIAATYGTVVVPADGTAASSSPNMIVGGTQARAHFNVGGENGLGYVISLPSATTLIDDSGVGLPMSVDLALDRTSGSIGDAGNGFNVGGTLHVANGQTPGNYSGSFQVQVQYN